MAKKTAASKGKGSVQSSRSAKTGKFTVAKSERSAVIKKATSRVRTSKSDAIKDGRK